MLASIRSATVGRDGCARPVLVEAVVGRGLPSFAVVGLPSARNRETRDRIRAAILSAGLEWPMRQTVVVVAPTGFTVHRPSLDLAIAAAVLVATEQVPEHTLTGAALFGELGLDGSVRPVADLAALMEAGGGRRSVVPAGNADEASRGELPQGALFTFARDLASFAAVHREGGPHDTGDDRHGLCPFGDQDCTDRSHAALARLDP